MHTPSVGDLLYGMGSMTMPDWVKDQLDHSPVRKARKKHFRDLTTFANQSKTSYSVAYFTELGCYSSIPTILCKSLESKGVDLSKLHSAYFEFQKDSRQHFALNFIAPKRSVLNDNLYLNPEHSFVRVLRDTLEISRAALSKGLCIQPASLYRLENNKLSELPSELFISLVHCGFTHKEVETFNGRERKLSTT